MSANVSQEFAYLRISLRSDLAPILGVSSFPATVFDGIGLRRGGRPGWTIFRDEGVTATEGKRVCQRRGSDHPAGLQDQIAVLGCR